MAERVPAGLHLHVDAEVGAAGDMFLAAALAVGVPEALVRQAFDAVGLGAERLQVDHAIKSGLVANNVRIAVDEQGADHHHHTHYRDIVARLEAADLPTGAKQRAIDIFARIARAEAALHGTSIDAVAFHEVGAIDSIADVVGAAVALDWLAPASVTCRRIAMGHGTVSTAHGVLPVPSPAALEILREAGAVTVDGGVARELCTPTGAAILAHAVGTWQAMPSGRPVVIGLGAGDMDLPDRPNVLRLVVLDPGSANSDTVIRIEANVDDMSPEVCEHAAELMVKAGAIDVWWLPVTMKKSRPALLLQALAHVRDRDAVARVILTETTSIGVRFDTVERRVLDRTMEHVDTQFGRVAIKVARLDGQVVNAAPEYEECRAAATAHGVALKDVFAEAISVWRGAR